MAQEIQSRTQKHTKPPKKEASSSTKSKNKSRKGSFFLLSIALIIIAGIGGSMIGYGVIGDQNPSDVFKLETWTHLYALIFG